MAHDVGGIGGMERMHGETIRRLASRWDIHVVSTSLDPSLRSLVTWSRVQVPRRPFPVKFSLFFVLAGCRLWWERRRGDRPRVVHVCGAIVPNRADVATVHFCHAGFVAAGRCFAPSSSPFLRRWNTVLVRCLALLAERWCYRPSRLRAAHAVSAGVAGEIQRHYPGVAVDVVPNGVDTEHFRPNPDARRRVRRDYGVGNEALVALFVGGDWDRKGLSVVVRSLALARLGGADVRLWVVGAGDRDRFGREARLVGVEDSIKFMGRHDDPAPFYAAADVLVLPSRYETFSLVAFEAAATGLPVLATAVHGVVDLVGADEAGMILPAAPEQFGTALADLAADQERLRRLGVEARRRARTKCWDDVADRLHELLRRDVPVGKQA